MVTENNKTFACIFFFKYLIISNKSFEGFSYLIKPGNKIIEKGSEFKKKAYTNWGNMTFVLQTMYPACSAGIGGNLYFKFNGKYAFNIVSKL